jgi:trimeric autotransporter adhesin
MRIADPLVPRRFWLFALLAFALGAAPNLRAQILPPVWRWSNPAPFGADIYGIVYNNGTYVAVGEEGQIYITDDLTNWFPCQSGTQVALRAATFLGGRLVIAGESGTILFSDNLSTFYGEEFDTTNWLEGVAASTNLVVAVGDNASIYFSTNAVTWNQAGVSFGNWLNGVSYGGANTFVAVGQAGFVATSQNGYTWTEVNSGTKSNLSCVAWTGSRFLAGGDGGVALASTDGASWQSAAAGASNDIYAAAGTTNSQIVAGEDELRWKGNAGWINELSSSLAAPAPTWAYYTATWTTNDADAFIVGGETGMLAIGSNAATSIHWRTPGASVRSTLWQVTHMGTHYFTVGNFGTLMSSEDGIAWTVELTPGTNSFLLGVGGSSTNYMLAAGTMGTVLWATNAYEWFQLTSPTTNDLYGVLFDGGDYMLCGGKGTIFTSPDITTWTKRTTPTANTLSSLALYPGGWVSVGENGTILTSTNRIDWTLQHVTTNWLWQVKYLNGILVVVGQNGTILTSSDGSNWTQQNSGTTVWLNAADYLPGVSWFAVGDSGTILGSADTTNWTVLNTITYQALYGLSHSQGQLVAVGEEGVIIRSLVVPPTTPVNITEYSRVSGDDVFLFAGVPDQQFYLENSTDLTNWNQEAQLELFNGDPTYLYISTTNTEPQSFYRTQLITQ